jgi:hypothetical protein
VILGYLGAAPLPAAALLATVPVQPVSESERTVIAMPRQASAAPAASAGPTTGGAESIPAAPLGRAEIGEAVVAVLGARTGYRYVFPRTTASGQATGVS